MKGNQNQDSRRETALISRIEQLKKWEKHPHPVYDEKITTDVGRQNKIDKAIMDIVKTAKNMSKELPEYKEFAKQYEKQIAAVMNSGVKRQYKDLPQANPNSDIGIEETGAEDTETEDDHVIAKMEKAE
jgi:hypothetical protein